MEKCIQKTIFDPLFHVSNIIIINSFKGLIRLLFHHMLCILFRGVPWSRHKKPEEPWWPRKSAQSTWKSSGTPDGRRFPNVTRTLWSIASPGGWWSTPTSPGSGRAGTAAPTPAAGPRRGWPGTKSLLCPWHPRRPWRRSRGCPAPDQKRLMRMRRPRGGQVRQRLKTQLRLQVRKLTDYYFTGQMINKLIGLSDIKKHWCLFLDQYRSKQNWLSVHQLFW